MKLSWLYLLAAGCGAENDGLLVRVTSARAIPQQAERLELATFGLPDGTELDRTTFDLTTIDEFPAEVLLRRGPLTPSRVLLQSRAFVGRTVVATASRETDFVVGEARELALVDSPQVLPCGTTRLLTDDFEDGTPAPGWEIFKNGIGAAFEIDGHLQLEPSGSTFSDVGYRALRTYDLRAAAVDVHLVRPPDVPGVAQVRLAVTGEQGRRAAVELHSGVLKFWDEANGMRTDRGTAISFNADSTAYWRIGVGADGLRWETSANGNDWDLRALMLAPSWVASVRPELASAYDPVEGAPGTIQLDDFNGGRAEPVGWCPASFVDGAFLGVGWDGIGGTSCSATEADGQLTLALDGAGVCGRRSSTDYDLRGDAIAIEVANIAGGQLAFELDAGSGNVLRFVADPAMLRVDEVTAGVATPRAAMAFDSSAHRFWRIRETAGRIYWETSADGIRFIVVDSIDAPFDVSAVTMSVRLESNVATVASVRLR